MSKLILSWELNVRNLTRSLLVEFLLPKKWFRYKSISWNISYILFSLIYFIMLYFNSSFASKSISYTCIAKIHSVIGTHSVKFANQRTRRSMSTLYQPVNYQCYENSGLNFLKLCKKTDCREISNVPIPQRNLCWSLAGLISESSVQGINYYQ